MSGTLARTDREAKEAAERRAVAAEARVREVEREVRERREEACAETMKRRNAEARLSEAVAERDAALAEGERLRAALRDCLAYLWPSPDEGHTGFVDRLGMQFYEETRIWPPFKSAPLEVAREPSDEDHRAWQAWLEAKRDQAAAAGAALVSPSPRPAENEGNEAKENA
jgi:phage-related minor tail protein